jgi:predicted AAA+ superfamily ATPase
MMRRHAESRLAKWLAGRRRKPLLLRGARQVGELTLVRQFASQNGLTLNEVNLERNLALQKVFASLETASIRAELDAVVGRSITAPKSLLFLDEIQATPAALQALRYLHEELPRVPVVAAGSLVEFTLSDHAFSMPVGRIECHHLGPMGFRALLDVVEPQPCRYLDELDGEHAPPASAHRRLLARYRQFLFIGGMPEAVLAFSKSGSLRSLLQFVARKKPPAAVRFDTNPPSRQRAVHDARMGSRMKGVSFDLISLPLYAVGDLDRILDGIRRGR